MLLAVAFVAMPTIGHANGAEAAKAEGFDHTVWDGLLRKHVRGGKVAYGAWKADKASTRALAKHLEAVAAADISKVGGKNDRLAFWINAYNACVVSFVLERHPVRSVMDVKGFFKSLKCRVAGAARTLDGLEKGIIRKRFKEARVHFALNCASISCPVIAGTAWQGRGLKRRLDKVTRAFVRGGGARIEGTTLKLSRLFEWYADDFKGAAGSPIAFVARHLKGADAPGLTIKYDDYDWGINGR